MMTNLYLRFLIIPLFFFALHTVAAAAETTPPQNTDNIANKKHNLVLIHGLGNKHLWSDEFLETCLNTWGSGRVFVVYTSAETYVTEKLLNGKRLTFAGNKNKAGIDSITKQVAYLSEKIHILEEKHGLQKPFSIIAHSMGGLVARQYSYDNPVQVAGLVTLGTPHHGSPLAESFQWVGFFLSATDAIEDLKPGSMEGFNKRFPVNTIPLASNKGIHTIRGLPEGSDCFGWIGELFFGWHILSKTNATANDGLVPHDSSVIDGAEHIGDFPHYDHSDLVIHADVAIKAAEYLP